MDIQVGDKFVEEGMRRTATYKVIKLYGDDSFKVERSWSDGGRDFTARAYEKDFKDAEYIPVSNFQKHKSKLNI